MTGVETDGGVIEADAVVVALGPWSLLAAAWMDLPAVFGRRSPSLVYDLGTDVPADALFLEYQDESGVLTVEVFPRADGSTHVVAFRRRGAAAARPGRRDAGAGRDRSPAGDLRTAVTAVPPEKIIARQACFRPVTQDGLPLIGKVGEGAYVATGHSVWGILNAPATGEALAELIADGVARSTDLTPFDPRRLRPLDPALLRVGLSTCGSAA